MTSGLFLMLAAVVSSLPVVVEKDPLSGISFAVPKAWPCAEMTQPDVKALWLEGEDYEGKPTRVFAYLALPKGASAANPVPGMVLAHGGGGTAYINWVRTWAAKGYAAITVDTCGAIPVRQDNKYIRSGCGGPAGWGRFEECDKPVVDQWPYHAVGALVRAHSYLRSLPEVESEKTGLTGISWGGYLTMLTGAVDTRFKLAMPVYACGYYEEMQRYTKFYPDLLSKTDRERMNMKKWASLFDSCLYAPRLSMPVCWFASSNDFAFPFDLLQRTVLLPPEMPTLAIRVRMKHSHGPIGENMPELFQFADHHLRGGPALPKVETPVVADGRFTVRFDARGRKFARVDVNWCCDERPTPETFWQSCVRPVPAGDVFTDEVPASAKRLYVNFVIDGDSGEKAYPEALVSSPAVSL